MTPTKVRSAAYRARKKVRDSDALVRLERYEGALKAILFMRPAGPVEKCHNARFLVQKMEAIARHELELP